MSHRVPRLYISRWEKTLIGGHIKEAISFEVTHISSRRKRGKKCANHFLRENSAAFLPCWTSHGWLEGGAGVADVFEGRPFWRMDIVGHRGSLRNLVQHWKLLMWVSGSFLIVTDWWMVFLRKDKIQSDGVCWASEEKAQEAEIHRDSPIVIWKDRWS